eukprot:1881368-Ditylum_brightwellii.AAC.1
MATYVSLQAQGLYCNLHPFSHKIQICIDKNEHCSNYLPTTGLQCFSMMQTNMWHSTVFANRLNRERSAQRSGKSRASELG